MHEAKEMLGEAVRSVGGKPTVDDLFAEEEKIIERACQLAQIAIRDMTGSLRDATLTLAKAAVDFVHASNGLNKREET